MRSIYYQLFLLDRRQKYLFSFVVSEEVCLVDGSELILQYLQLKYAEVEGF